MLHHDAPLDYIATERELIATHTRYPRCAGVDWAQLRQDQMETIPILRKLREKLTAIGTGESR